jgi:hypothetical protein
MLQRANIAEGKCKLCREPLDRNSVQHCTKHLEQIRERQRAKSDLSGKAPHGRPFTMFGVHVKSIRSRNIPPVALAKSKSPTAPSDEMVWLGAGLLIAAVIMTIWMVLNG